jgi:hypothetical protein
MVMCLCKIVITKLQDCVNIRKSVTKTTNVGLRKIHGLHLSLPEQLHGAEAFLRI